MIPSRFPFHLLQARLLYTSTYAMMSRTAPDMPLDCHGRGLQFTRWTLVKIEWLRVGKLWPEGRYCAILEYQGRWRRSRHGQGWFWRYPKDSGICIRYVWVYVCTLWTVCTVYTGWNLDAHRLHVWSYAWAKSNACKIPLVYTRAASTTIMWKSWWEAPKRSNVLLNQRSGNCFGQDLSCRKWE